MKTIFALCEKELEKVEIEISRLEIAINQYKSGANPFEHFENTDKEYWFSMIIGMPIHAAYCGIESVIERLLKNIDKRTPSGDEFHKEMLLAASVDVDNLRPAIIGDKTLEELNNLRAFRHVIRKRYSHELGLERIVENGERIIKLFPLLTAEIREFQENYQSFQEKGKKPPRP